MIFTPPQATPERQAFYDRISRENLAPLWQVPGGLGPRRPRSPGGPAFGGNDPARPSLLEAGNIISTKEAERRGRVLEKPGLRGSSSITRTLYAGPQLILPGEIAASHRHTQSALR